MIRVAVLAAALLLVPSAATWKRLTPDELSNTADPALLRARDGPLLVAYATKAGALKVVRGGSESTLLTGRFARDPQLVARPDGSLYLFAGSDTGVVRFGSGDGGRTWSGPSPPVPTSRAADVQAATVLADGTPLFSQDGTGFLDIYRGQDGASRQNVFPACCAYAESLAVGHEQIPYVAFWSNATGQAGYLFGRLGGPYTNLSGGADTVSRTDRVPLVADSKGNVYTAWASGYPEATALRVRALHDGAGGDVVVVRGRFGGGDPRLALAIGPRDRLWLAYTRSGTLFAARSRGWPTHFGATVRAKLPAGVSVYGIEASAAPDGDVDVVANLGTALWTQHLLPGLSARAYRTVRRVGKRTIVTRYGEALDDGDGVPGAIFTRGGRTVRANKYGVARLAAGTYRVSAQGYVGTTLRIP